MARKTKEEALKTREAILDAATEVFADKGVSKATLESIAKKAKMTRGAFYYHFKNKEDMLAALWERLLLPFEPIKLLCEDPNEPDPLGKLNETHMAFFRSLHDDPQMLKLWKVLLAKCEAVDDTCTPDLHRQTHVDGQVHIENVLQNAINHGQLPTNLDVRLGALAIISYIHGLINNYIMFPDLVDVNTDIPVMLDGLMNMLRTSFLKT